MTAIFETIKTAYEVEKMSPQQIADDQDLDPAAVKAALMQCSSKYRKDCGVEAAEEDELNFNREEQLQIKRAIFEMALTAEDEHVRSKMLTYCRDDAKGRKDVVRQIAGNTFNILQINEGIKRARQMADGLKQRLIEV